MSTGKGQSAIEYLMTYGWMLLVVALIGGAVFSLVQGQAIESVSGFTGTEVSINDFGMNSEDELALSMKNTAADEVRIKAVELEDPVTGATTRVLSEKQIEVGDRKTVKVDGFERTSSSNKQNLKIIYGSGGNDDQVVEGTITGKLKAKNHVYLQNAVFNRSTNTLNITAQNTGNTEADVEYAVKSDSNSFTGNLGTLPSGETTSFTVNTDETFPLQNVSLNVDGQYFSNSQKQLKCTPTKGLIGYWPFNKEQTKNGYAIDLSGYGNKGSLENGVTTSVDGRVGEAYSFDGSDDYVEVQETRKLNLTEQLTIFGAIKPSDLPFDNYGMMLEKRRPDGGYALLSGKGGRRVRYELAEGSADNFDSPTILSQSTWYKASMTYNGTHLRGYLDGENEGSILASLSSSEGVNLFIGSRTGSGENFNGSVDEVRIYNRSLSQQEIQRLYNVKSEDWAVDSCKLTN